MIIRLFGCMGVLGQEKKPVWYEAPSYDCPVPALAYEYWADLPDEYQPYKNPSDQTVITIDGLRLMLDEVLHDVGGVPAIGFFPRLHRLDEVKRPRRGGSRNYAN